MKNETVLIQKRRALLKSLAELEVLVQGAYLERVSTCTRRNCACHRGAQHGPRGYLVVYRDKKQHQIYIPLAEREAIRRGTQQYGRLKVTLQAITRLNLQLMRQGKLSSSTSRKQSPAGGKP